MSEDRPGHTVGYGYEYIEILENYVPCEFEYIVFDDWTDLLNSLNSGEIDIVPNLPGDHKWLINARSTDHVVGRFPMELVITPDKIKPHINLARVQTNYDTPGLDEVAREEGIILTFDISKSILTVPEVASILNCSSQKIYELIHLKKISAYKDFKTDGKHGRAWKITAFSVYRYIIDSLNIYEQKM